MKATEFGELMQNNGH